MTATKENCYDTRKSRRNEHSGADWRACGTMEDNRKKVGYERAS